MADMEVTRLRATVAAAEVRATTAEEAVRQLREEYDSFREQGQQAEAGLRAEVAAESVAAAQQALLEQALTEVRMRAEVAETEAERQRVAATEAQERLVSHLCALITSYESPPCAKHIHKACLQ